MSTLPPTITQTMLPGVTPGVFLGRNTVTLNVDGGIWSEVFVHALRATVEAALEETGGRIAEFVVAARTRGGAVEEFYGSLDRLTSSALVFEDGVTVDLYSVVKIRF